jgi:hypothetical protein
MPENMFSKISRRRRPAAAMAEAAAYSSSAAGLVPSRAEARETRKTPARRRECWAEESFI